MVGENSDKSLFGNSKIKTHAEIDALKKLLKLIKFKKIKKPCMDLLVLRVNKNLSLGESAPCYHCTQMLSKCTNITIDKLYYSCNGGSICCIKFSDWVINGTDHVSKGWRVCHIHTK